MADPAKYLLPTERPVINIRRHWAVLAGATIQSLLLLILGVLLARVMASVDFVGLVAVYFCVFVVVRWLWIIGDWYVEKLVVTQRNQMRAAAVLVERWSEVEQALAA